MLWLDGMKRAILATFAIASRASYAHADADADAKSEAVATGLPVASLLVGSALVAGGLHTLNDDMLFGGTALTLFGPSLGPLYAGRITTNGLCVRLGGALVATAGDAVWLFDRHNDAGVGLMVAGAGAVALGAWIDVRDARRAVRVYNSSRALTLAPLVLHAPGAHAAGFTLAGTF
jgi:hypothetical protein